MVSVTVRFEGLAYAYTNTSEGKCVFKYVIIILHTVLGNITFLIIMLFLKISPYLCGKMYPKQVLKKNLLTVFESNYMYFQVHFITTIMPFLEVLLYNIEIFIDRFDLFHEEKCTTLVVDFLTPKLDKIWVNI